MTISKSDKDILVRPVISSLPIAIIVVNKDRRVKLSNKAAQEISQKSEEEIFDLHGGEVMGCTYSDKHPDGCGYHRHCEFCQIRNSVLDTFDDGEGRTLTDAQLTLKDYGVRDLKVSTTYINLDDIHHEVIELDRRETYGRRKTDLDKELVIVSIEDITDFKKREKLETVVETVGAACHELNNPLQSVTGYLELLRMKAESGEITPEQVLDYVSKIVKHTDKLSDVTSSLLTLQDYQTKPYLDGRIIDLEKSMNGK